MALANDLIKALRSPFSGQYEIRHDYGVSCILKDDSQAPLRHTKGPTTVASFRTWRGSRDFVAQDPAIKGFSARGGEGGIRTLGALLTHTRFPIVPLRPLGHLSTGSPKIGSLLYTFKSQTVNKINIWRRGWDSNPRYAFWAYRRFRVAPVMTASVPLRNHP